MRLSGLIVALQLMTRLPVPSIEGESRRELASAAPFLPLAGALVGAVVASAVWAGGGISPSVSALLGVVAWVGVTGALHLEGLGDVADGLGAAHGDSERFLAVARDPHVGGFGAAVMMLQLVAKLVLLAEVALGRNYLAVILIAAWARWGTLLLARAVPPLSEGMGQRLAGGVTWRLTAVLAAVLALASYPIAPVLTCAPLITLLLAGYWRRRLGGITGDCHGASIEVSETVLLFLLVAVGF
ncbi:MAG: adenosylcobinamide-GDP ribazoletransferase [Hyphomicrobium sp.]|jgi:adenosylcobinamide-GDP ribazoletransferase